MSASVNSATYLEYLQLLYVASVRVGLEGRECSMGCAINQG